MWRWAPTVMPGCRSSVAMTGVLPAMYGLGPLADQEAGVEVVGGEQRVDRGLRVGGRVERDDDDALVAGLLDARDDGLGVARGDEDALGPGVDHVLEGRDLARVVAVLGAGAGEQLDAELIRLGLGAFLHLDEERVGLRLGDEADDDLALRQTPGRKRAPGSRSSRYMRPA